MRLSWRPPQLLGILGVLWYGGHIAVAIDLDLKSTGM